MSTVHGKLLSSIHQKLTHKIYVYNIYMSKANNFWREV